MLSSRRRRQFARQLRRLAETGAVTVEATAEPDRVRARFEEFLALEARGRKGRRGTALASSVATAAFARDVVFNRSERGTVRIASIRVGERPVAIVVSFVAGATAYAWRIAYDEDFAALLARARSSSSTCRRPCSSTRPSRPSIPAPGRRPLRGDRCGRTAWRSARW